MATGLLETGPKLDLTRDNKIFDRYQIWKEKVELIFSSALEESSSKQKVSYLRYWMGEQGIPLVKKWTALGKLDFSSAEEDALSSGYILQNYWNLLEAEFKPKGNKLLSVIELWTRSKQGSKTLNEWLTYVYNLVESCDYGDSNERIIRDVLIIGCNSDKAKDKIVRQGEKIKLQDVIEILQLEDSTRQTLTEMTSTTQKIHYASYEKKKGTGKKQKFQSNSNSSSSSSSGQKQDSTGSQKLCYRCSKNYTKGHEKVCKALNAKCNACGVEGHFEIACKKSGNFPKKSSSKFQKPGSTGRMNIASAVEEPALQADFFDEKGILKEYKPKSMYVLSGTSDDKPIMIEFGCGLTPLSFDRKLTLQADTGADMNAINKKTFDELFPDVELEESTHILQNFDKRLIKPIGSFRCFLRWKGHKYRVKFEVMGIETPNLLSRETTFLMGILKKCLSVEKTQNEPSNQISSPPVSGHSVPPTEAAPVPLTEGASCHSVPPTEAAPVPLTEGVSCHSVPLTETAPLTSTEVERSQMNCASISDTAETPDSSSVRVLGSNNHSLSITDLPLTQEKVETTYADVFQGLGKFPGEPYKLRLKPDAVPAKHRPRRVPVHLQDAFHEEIERLVKIDVLEKVTEPTEWVNSFVIVEKVIDSSNAHSPNHVIKKSIRLCIDPKDLNEALEREPYYSRSIDELISMFAGAKVFTIVDMDKGYWQVVLHPESRKLTCMAFDIGRYQFKRLPMGSKVASDIFQRMLDSVYIGLPGVTGIADDMVIFGRNEEEHDRNLILFLETTRKNGLVLNKKKLQFKKEEVSFFGHRWNSTGISPDPKKTESILKMQFPPDKETMHSFLGLVNFLNRYTPKLAELCSPLRKLILKDSHYSPGDPEHAAFDAIKAEFKKKIILPYFDRNKETILQTDASKKGFGAVILQEEQPIYYASRALTSAEKNYQNLEREAQAAVWGMEKFHYFLYGRKFILQTDQKPLVSIFRKHMIDVSPRIQRITIRAWQYDFVPQHIPGRINVIADSLSRVTPLEFQDSNAEKDILAVNFLQYSSIEERERDEMLQETSKDKELQSLKHYISTGWPSKRSQIPVSLHPYWNYRDELTVESGILMKNSKVLIPETLKQKYLRQIHQGHQGIEACRSRAREFVFWVNINSDLKEMVEKCDICQSQQNSTASVQKYVSEVPPHPWHTLGSDLFYFQRIDFLVVVDYFSKYLIVRKIPSSTSSAVIKELGMIFSEFGNPLVFRSDNGPCYSSQEFKFFMQNWLVEHRTSSPHYPQSNGLAESMVKVSKNLIEKAIKQDLPWNKLLLDYRCTPISSEIPSPAEILFGRKFRSSISILPSQVLNDRISKQRELIAKKEGKFYASTQNFQDRIKALPFEAGQNVWLQDSDSRKFEEAVIREKCREPNSYMVEIPATGQCFRRNSNFIKPRQSDKNSVSTDPLPTTGLPEIPQEPPVLQQPSSLATSTVDAIPTVPPSKQNGNSTPRTPRHPRVSRRSNKGIPPQGLDYKSDISCTDILISEREMLRYDTIGKIELIPSIVLSSDNTKYKNDIQLFLQLFDELSVYRDYH